jgi:tetratricopeptide (TPR) repeat protein
LAGVLTLVGLFVLYTGFRTYTSEYLMKKARMALDAGNSQAVYDLHLKAIRYSPNIASYHLSFAEINFRLASALSQKESLSDADRETISRLVQQSVSSSKTAISLRPNSATAWISLAKIYQNLINVAEGSDKFALESFAKSISLDRANPALRLEFGNLLSQLGNNQTSAADKATFLSRAKIEFQTAIQLKKDYVNAYYNLAKLYEAEADYPNAVTSMQQVLKYLDETSAEYARASSELDILKSKLPKSTPTPTPSSTPATDSTLTDPSPLPSPLPGGPVELSPTP